MRRWWPLLLAGAISCGASQPMPREAAHLAPPLAMTPEPTDAEYAVRWDAATGGPKTAAQVLEKLVFKSAKPKDCMVQYFAVTKPPADAPEDFPPPVLRQRTSKKKAQLTFKYRGTQPIASWRCPLVGHEKKVKDEVDVSFTDAATTSRAFSYSCDVKDAEGLPQDLGPVATGCQASMKRFEVELRKGAELKVEEWHLGKAVYIEVSLGGKKNNTPRAATEFRDTVVTKLIALGVKPSAKGMTTLTMECNDKKK